MGTIRDLVTGSLRLIEEVGAGDVCTAESATDGLTSLNGMIGSWGIQGDMVFTETQETFTLSAGQGTRTIGATGQLATTRPIRVNSITTSLVGGYTQNLEQFDQYQWAGIEDKTITGYPTIYYYDGNYPNGTLYFYPVPSTTFTMVLYSEKPLSEYTSINDTLVAPPGWERAFRYNLAVEIAPEYGKDVRQSVISIAIESKNAVRAQNTKNDGHSMAVDDGLLLKNRFDILSGR